MLIRLPHCGIRKKAFPFEGKVSAAQPQTDEVESAAQRHRFSFSPNVGGGVPDAPPAAGVSNPAACGNKKKGSLVQRELDRRLRRD